MSQPRYIDAAFRSTKENEAYLFMKNECLLINYAPGSTDDRIVYGPLLISDGFPSLSNHIFATQGIDCAFDSEPSPEAFIFSGNQCARINYSPHSRNDYIIAGPMTITSMFPFFKGTVFENGIDAAFSSSKSKEVYLFKGDRYARINYESKHLLQPLRYIGKEFPCLADTVFESGIDAAFASQQTNEAYIFKGEYYTLINYAPDTTNDYIIGDGVKQILDYWPSLRDILPRYD